MNATPPTNAPSSIGALAASLQAIELEKILADDLEHALVGLEVYLDATHHRHFVTRFRRNPDCRFDHEVWQISRCMDRTLAEALELAGDNPTTTTLAVDGDVFVQRLVCAGCGRSESVLGLRTRGAYDRRRCPACKTRMTVYGFSVLDRLSEAGVDAPALGRLLSEVGLRTGDVFTVDAQDREPVHFRLEVGTATASGSGTETGPCTVVVAGCGNIGSHLVPHLARMAAVERLILVDPDSYERKNLGGQAIRRSDVGRAKATTQAETARAIRPGLDVQAVVDRIENLPLGWLEGSVIASCLDSLAARQSVNEAAWRVGSTWVDAAVDADGRLARVIVYAPSPEAPCLECAWGPSDYAALEQRMPCEDLREEPTASAGSAC
jgi:hypothetical protein